MRSSRARHVGVVLAISGTGQTRELIRSVETARDAGASVIAITASGSPLAQLASVVLSADVPEDLDVYAPMTTRMVHLVMIDVLSVGLANKKGPGPLDSRSWITDSSTISIGLPDHSQI